MIHRAIKSAGRRCTISLLVNYTGNPELRSFCYSMLHPNNACRKHLILSFYQRMKKSSIRRQWLPAKDLPAAVVKKLTNYEHLSLRQKSKFKLLPGFISPVHFVVAMENTSNPRCHLIHK